MITINKGKVEDGELLSEISKRSFLDSHGNSALTEDINAYIAQSFDVGILEKELTNTTIDYYIISYENQVAGYSKIIYDSENKCISSYPTTKLDRIYLLKEFHGKRLGNKLMHFNLALSKKKQQRGMWLYVWEKNDRAIHFYKKIGFDVVGSYDFKISATHSNPNHIMYLEY